MATETTTTCDVCDRDVAAIPYPWPLTTADMGGASKDVCSEECLLDLAICLLEDRARNEGLSMRRPVPPAKRWWQR